MSVSRLGGLDSNSCAMPSRMAAGVAFTMVLEFDIHGHQPQVSGEFLHLGAGQQCWSFYIQWLGPPEYVDQKRTKGVPKCVKLTDK